MFESFFGMERTPFTNQIPTDALALTKAQEEALGRIVYAAKNQLFAVVTGDVGMGKSTLVRKMRDTLPKDEYLVLYLSDSQLTPRWFYNGLLLQLGSEPKFQRGDAKMSLHRQLEYIREAKHQKVVTIVDEAHLLRRETLEEIRFLLNCKMDSQNPMALILVGQSELWDKLVKPVYAAIRQRIDLKCILPPLDLSETKAYICAHLRYAGGQTEIFSDSAVEEICRCAAGSSRAINKVCTHCLLSAAQHEKKIIDDHMVQNVVATEIP